MTSTTMHPPIHIPYTQLHIQQSNNNKWWRSVLSILGEQLLTHADHLPKKIQIEQFIGCLAFAASLAVCQVCCVNNAAWYFWFTLSIKAASKWLLQYNAAMLKQLWSVVTCLQCFGWQEGHTACKKLKSGGILALSVWGGAQICTWPRWCTATHYLLL